MNPVAIVLAAAAAATVRLLAWGKRSSLVPSAHSSSPWILTFIWAAIFTSFAIAEGAAACLILDGAPFIDDVIRGAWQFNDLSLWQAGCRALLVACLTCLGLCCCPVIALFLEGATLLPLVCWIHGGRVALAAWLALGAGTGCALVLLGRFWPPRSFMAAAMALGRRFSIPVQVLSRDDDSLGQSRGALGSTTSFVWAGAAITLLSELALVPAAWTILFVVARLRLAGESFDDGDRRWCSGNTPAEVGSSLPSPWSPSSSSASSCTPDTIVCLVHGSGFNEAQWLMPRLWMHGRGWTANKRGSANSGSDENHGLGRVGFLAVNYLSGPVLVSETFDSNSLQKCAAVATSQLEALVTARGWNTTTAIGGKARRLVLVGHSLGGYVAAYMRESKQLGSASRLPPITQVVAMSTPLVGSAILAWAMKRLPSMVTKVLLLKGIKRDFMPDSPVAAQLRQAMARRLTADSGTASSSYFFISAVCDPLVRPDSALPTFAQDCRAAAVPSPLPKLDRALVPLLGHYNIMVGISTWDAVMAAVERRAGCLN